MIRACRGTWLTILMLPVYPAAHPGWPGVIVSCPGQIAPPAPRGIAPRLCLNPASLLLRRLRLGGPRRGCLPFRLRSGRPCSAASGPVPPASALSGSAPPDPVLPVPRSAVSGAVGGRFIFGVKTSPPQRALDQVDGLGGGSEPGPLPCGRRPAPCRSRAAAVRPRASVLAVRYPCRAPSTHAFEWYLARAARATGYRRSTPCRR